MCGLYDLSKAASFRDRHALSKRGARLRKRGRCPARRVLAAPGEPDPLERLADSPGTDRALRELCERAARRFDFVPAPQAHDPWPKP